jgi:hypothetical protein
MIGSIGLRHIIFFLHVGITILEISLCCMPDLKSQAYNIKKLQQENLAAIEKKHGKCENDKLFSTQ